MTDKPPTEADETGFEPDLLVAELLGTVGPRARGDDRAQLRARAIRREIETILRQGGEPRHLLAEALLEGIEHVAGGLASTEGEERSPAAGRMFVLEEDLRLLGRIVSETEQIATPPAWIEAQTELAWAAGQIGEIAGSEGNRDAAIDAVRRRLVELSARLLQSRARVLAGESAGGGRPADKIARLERAVMLRAELLELGDVEPATPATIDALAAQRDAIRQSIETDLRQMSDPVSRADERAAVAEALADRVSDRLAGLEDHPLDAVIQICRDLRDDLVWMHRLMRERGPRKGNSGRPDRRTARARRRLRRLGWRLAAELEEREVQRRLERWIGRRSAAALERSILLLILGVVLMLVVEGCFVLEPPWPHIMAAIDLSICVVFLAEYALKTGASPTPWRYARRHFLLDFLPSIPYGVMLHLSGFDIARSARAIRLARLPRLARYLRTLRPLIRSLRLLGFALRGLDRLVRRHASLLNVNVILFETEFGATRRPLGPRFEAAARRCRGRLADLTCRLALDDQLAIVGARLDRAAKVVDGAGPGALADEPPDERSEPGAREIGFRNMVEILRTLDASLVRSALGLETAQRVQSLLRCLDLPLLRSLPLVRSVSRGVRHLDPFEATARCGRSIGTLLERMTRVALVIGDLWGVVTAPRLLDRVGTAMSLAAKRPAMRLLIFGTLFLLLQLIVEGLGLTGLEGLTSWITRIVGAPLLILGSVCLVFFLLGRWFQQIAGEATETFRCIAEAQYINILEECKRRYQDTDLRTLYRRILARTSDPLEERAGVRELAGQVQSGEDSGEEVPPGTLAPNALARWGDLERIVLLYRDHLDGGVLHRSDTKTSEQLLGNLALQNIRDERLGVDRRERKRLARLDLSQSRGLSIGPHVWFQAITGSLAEQTAKLLVEYDRHAIPLAERPRYAPAELEQFAAWLRDADGAGGRTETTDYEAVARVVDDARSLRTTQFTALHFLNVEARRDALVRQEFGAAVHERMCRDRRAMVRHVFGHFPYERIPRSQRTFNPYDFYWKYLGGARIALTPFVAFYLGARFTFLGLRLTARTVRALLDPTRATGPRRDASCNIDVAYRKIARMRRPIYMECLDFRTRFDPEYLGCTLPGLDPPPASIAAFEEDLAFIKADADDYRRYEARRNLVRARLERLERHLTAAHLDDAAIRELQRRHLNPAGEESGGTDPEAGPHLPSLADSRRALAIAYTIDYRDFRTRLHLEDDLRSLLEEAIRRRGRPLTSKAAGDRGKRPRRTLRLAPFSRRLRRGLDQALAALFGSLPRRHRAWCMSYVRQDVHGLRRRLEILRRDGSIEAARRHALQIRDDTLAHPRLWRRQLITLRALQTLAVMDVRNDRDAVTALAELPAPESG